MKSGEEDKSHLVIDHDVHVSLAGMDEALRTALRHLEPGLLSDAVDRIRCPHHPSKVSPHALSQVKRISYVGWERLNLILSARLPDVSQRQAEGRVDSSASLTATDDADVIPSSQLEELGVVDSLGLSELCLTCARVLYVGDVQRQRDVEEDRQLLKDYKEYRASHRSADRSSKQPIAPPAGALWVDKEWIQRWKRRAYQIVSSSKSAKDAAQASQLDNKLRSLREETAVGDLTASLLCEHGNLDPDPTRRVFVSRDLWFRLIKAGSLESLMLSAKQKECSKCKQADEAEDAVQKQYAASMKEEKVALRSWTSRDMAFPTAEYPPDVNSTRRPEYFLVPTTFRESVAAYIKSRDMAAVRPKLDLSSLLCPEHRLLLYQPRPAWEVGESGLRGTAVGVMTPCDDAVWAALHKYGYVASDEAGIRLTVQKISIPAMHLHSHVSQWTLIDTKTEPAVCVDCALKRQKAEEAERLRFTREDGGGITVVPVNTEGEAMDSEPVTSSKGPSPINPSPTTTSSPGAVSPSLTSTSATSSRPRRAGVGSTWWWRCVPSAALLLLRPRVRAEAPTDGGHGLSSQPPAVVVQRTEDGQHQVTGRLPGGERGRGEASHRRRPGGG